MISTEINEIGHGVVFNNVRNLTSSSLELPMAPKGYNSTKVGTLSPK
jgi:hypothetical protein